MTAVFLLILLLRGMLLDICLATEPSSAN